MDLWYFGLGLKRAIWGEHLPKGKMKNSVMPITYKTITCVYFQDLQIRRWKLRTVFIHWSVLASIEIRLLRCLYTRVGSCEPNILLFYCSSPKFTTESNGRLTIQFIVLIYKGVGCERGLLCPSKPQAFMISTFPVILSVPNSFVFVSLEPFPFSYLWYVEWEMSPTGSLDT